MSLATGLLPRTSAKALANRPKTPRSAWLIDGSSATRCFFSALGLTRALRPPKICAYCATSHQGTQWQITRFGTFASVTSGWPRPTRRRRCRAVVAFASVFRLRSSASRARPRRPTSYFVDALWRVTRCQREGCLMPLASTASLAITLHHLVSLSPRPLRPGERDLDKSSSFCL